MCIYLEQLREDIFDSIVVISLGQIKQYLLVGVYIPTWNILSIHSTSVYYSTFMLKRQYFSQVGSLFAVERKIVSTIHTYSVR